MSPFNGVKVFAATMVRQRAEIDALIEHWLEAMRRRPGFEIVDVVVRQSSDDAYHCLTYVFFFNETAPTLQRATR